MGGKINFLSGTALFFYGIILFIVISNQELRLDDIRKKKVVSVESNEYQLSHIGSESYDIKKYQINYGKGKVLYSFSAPSDFISILKLRYKSIKQIQFKTSFVLTENTVQKTVSSISRYVLHVKVKDIEYRLHPLIEKKNTIDLKISPNDEIMIWTEAPMNVSGAVMMTITRSEKGSVGQYLLINAVWAISIILFLLHKNIYLPVLSGTLFFVFIKAEELYTKILLWEQLCLYSAIAIAAGLLLLFLSSLGKNNKLLRGIGVGLSLLLILLVAIFPVVTLGFYYIFDTVMSKYDWFAILQTDLAETREFLIVFAPIPLLAAFTGGIIALIVVFLKSHRKQLYFLSPRWGIVAFCIAAIFMYNDRSLLFKKSFAAIQEYHEDTQLLKKKAQLRKNKVGTIQAEKEQGDELYILIIGESANRNHFSIYGYPRDTSPKLKDLHEKNELICYDQAYSCGISTLGSLRYALTSATLTNGASPHTAPSLIEVLNAADFETFWLHNGSSSIRSNILGVISDQATYTDHLSTVYGLEDGKLIAEVDKVLAKKKLKNRAIFLKTQGSHVSYCRRLPDEDMWKFKDAAFDRWLIPDRYEITKISSESGCYDGTIKYTDYVIDEIIKRAEQTAKVASVIYLSDHGDEIVEGTAHMTHSPTYGIFSVPMFIWFSKEYKQRYQDKVANVSTNAANVFVNDVLFDSLLGIMGVDTKESFPENDISSDKYKNRKFIYRGKKTVYDSDNYIYYTSKNIDKILKSNSPYNVYLGPLEHPFHLSAVKQENYYQYIAISGIFQDGKFNIDSPLYRKNKTALDILLNYLSPAANQNFFFRLDPGTENSEVSREAASVFLTLLKEYNITPKHTIAASTSPLLLKLLKKQGIKTSYISSGSELVSEQADQHDAIFMDFFDLIRLKENPQKDIGSTPIDVYFSSCDIKDCVKKHFKDLDILVETVNIRNVIVPVFSL